ncbi:hypothetical protein COL23_17425 [Priestia aryabhattai]|nr:hypothetical protein COL23_17425 [Priestia aryabhattai]
MILILTYKAIKGCIETEGSNLSNREYPYCFIKLGKLYYVYHSYKDVKKKEVCRYEFTNDEPFAFPIPAGSIAKLMADECGGHIVVKNATFNDYIRQGE